jgi:hypothetical protein
MREPDLQLACRRRRQPSGCEGSSESKGFTTARKPFRLPVLDFNREQTAASRARLEIFLKEKGAQLWIQHDIAADEKLRKSPEFYN